jgi:hypothetical protein
MGRSYLLPDGGDVGGLACSIKRFNFGDAVGFQFGLSVQSLRQSPHQPEQLTRSCNLHSWRVFSV